MTHTFLMFWVPRVRERRSGLRTGPHTVPCTDPLEYFWVGGDRLRFQYNGDLGARFHAWCITELPANFPWRRLKSEEVLGPPSAFIKGHTVLRAGEATALPWMLWARASSNKPGVYLSGYIPREGLSRCAHRRPFQITLAHSSFTSFQGV